MKLSKRTWLIGISATLGVAAAAFWLTRSSEPGPAVAAAEIPVSAFYDWNLAQGDLADRARELTTDRLFELGADGRYVYRLARAIDLKGDVARVTLKDSVYWSDQVQLTADHVADAWRRLVEAPRRGIPVALPGDEQIWPANFQVKAIGKLELEITGFSSPEVLSQLVRSRYLAPIRSDLIAEDKGWLVTIGRYRLAELPPKALPADASLSFVPNPVYFRGPATEGVKLALSPSEGT